MKRGSLSLSVNAIVVLVLALTMLGVGIAFTKNMLGGLSDKVVVPEPTVKATRSDPIQLAYEKINAEVDRELEFTVSVYNTKSSVDASGNSLEMSYSSKCMYKDSSGFLEINTLYDNENNAMTPPLALSQFISQGQAGNFKFTMPSPATSNTFTCTLTFCVGATIEMLGEDCDDADASTIIGSKQYIISFN